MIVDIRVKLLQTHLIKLFEKVALNNISGWNKVVFDPATGAPNFDDIEAHKTKLIKLLPTLATKKTSVQKQGITLTGALNPVETIRLRFISKNKHIYVMDTQKSHIELDANRFVKSVCMLYHIKHHMVDLDVNLKCINSYLKAAQRIHAPVYKVAEALYKVYTRHAWLKSLAPQLKNNDGTDRNINYLLGNYLKYICCFSLINSWCTKQRSLYTDIKIEAIPCRADNKEIYQLKLMAVPKNTSDGSLAELVICTEFGMTLKKLKDNKLELTSDDLSKTVDGGSTHFFKNLLDCMEFEQQQFENSGNTVFKRDFFIDILLKGPNKKFVVVEAKFRTDAFFLVDELSRAIRTQNYEYTQFLKELYTEDGVEPEISNYLMASYLKNAPDICKYTNIYTDCIQKNNEPKEDYLELIGQFTDKILDEFNK